MEKSTFELINELISAVAHLLWPIIVLALFIIFKIEIKTLLNRLRRGKIFGSEIELDDEIERLQDTAKQASNEVPETNAASQVGIATDEFERQILDEAKKRPTLAIVVLAREMERQVRLILGSRGMLGERSYTNMRQAFQLMDEKGLLPKHTLSSMEIFWDLRNKLVHGRDEEVAKIVGVIDIGTTLLRTLRSIPHEVHSVKYVDIDIYSDSDCSLKRNGVKGVILDSKSAGGVKNTIRIFPTTKINYYEPGKQVSWEWNLKNGWGKSWYKDPETQQNKEAWISAGEFIGRHLGDL